MYDEHKARAELVELRKERDELERELAAEREKVAELEWLLESETKWAGQYKSERDQWREVADRLAAASSESLSLIEGWYFCGGEGTEVKSSLVSSIERYEALKDRAENRG